MTVGHLCLKCRKRLPLDERGMVRRHNVAAGNRADCPGSGFPPIGTTPRPAIRSVDEALELVLVQARLALLRLAPRVPHLELPLAAALEWLERALRDCPAAAAKLERLPLGESFLATHAVLGRALRIPVKLIGSQEEWAELATLLRPRDGEDYTPRHAARVWSDLTTHGKGVREARFDRAYVRPCKTSRCGRCARCAPVRFPWQKRADGTPFPSSLKAYQRAYIRSVAYVTSEALVAADTDAARELAAAVSRRIPKAWRGARWARFRRCPELRSIPFDVLASCRNRDELRQVTRTGSIRRHYRVSTSTHVISRAQRYAVKSKKDGASAPAPSRPPAGRRAPPTTVATPAPRGPSTGAPEAPTGHRSADVPPVPPPPTEVAEERRAGGRPSKDRAAALCGAAGVAWPSWATSTPSRRAYGR